MGMFHRNDDIFSYYAGRVSRLYLHSAMKTPACGDMAHNVLFYFTNKNKVPIY
jgi:hypothetical protein